MAKDIKQQSIFNIGNFYGNVVKRQKDGFCQQCKKEINKGDEVLRVEKRDGFLVKSVGLCHIECFESFKKN